VRPSQARDTGSSRLCLTPPGSRPDARSDALPLTAPKSLRHEADVLQIIFSCPSEWPLTWQDSLKNHVNIRACPPYVRGRGGMIHEIMHNHGQRPYGLSISMFYFP